MPIGLGLASSHAPSMDARLEQWAPIYQRLIRNVPQPPEASQETPEVIRSYIGRIQSGFATLRRQLTDYRADLLIIIGGDQTEMFDDSNKPNLMIYLGEFAWGSNVLRLAGEAPSEGASVRLKVDVETSKWLLQRLVVQEGFDMAFSGEQCALGRAEQGLPHAFVRPAPHLMPKLDIPVVLIYESTFDAPCLTAQRCYDLGRTLARLLKSDPRKIAIFGSGGLSHDPGGARAGWIDEPLDRWFLDQLALGNGRATTSMYSFDSMTMRGGTGEMRTWITVAGAMDEMGSPQAVVVDYIPAHQAVTGLAWAYWPPKAERHRTESL